MIAQTSLMSYSWLADNKKLAPMQRMVFNAICELGVANCEMVCAQTGLPEKTVSGRLNDLWSKFKIIGVERVGKNSNGRSVKYYSIRDANDGRLREVSHEAPAAVYVGLDIKH